MMTALTTEELMAWVERTTTGWRELVAQHPEVLTMPCDVRETKDVAGLLQHIVAIELRYAQRIQGVSESSNEQVLGEFGSDLFAPHDQAIRMLHQLVKADTKWEEEIDFQTRSVGVLRATRRTILVHSLMHSVRHYAQLATLIRQRGVQPGWPMDYLFMAAHPA